MFRSYKESIDWLSRAESVIPLGSQTFSKSQLQFPRGVAPLFIERGKGANVWDKDNNRYVDFVNGLLSVSLGYCDPAVDAAVKEQLSSGVTFSLPHRLEAEVAEQLIELIPCAEQVRFGKNGSDATSAAVRLARAYTGREHVAMCGYHGWHDWYIGSTTRDLGVPEEVKALSHKFAYNDLESLAELFDRHSGQIACVVLEPMNTVKPDPGFLSGVVRLCEKNGTIAIFDEMITGFRFHLGGAQAAFGVTPHIATFGKGMANGYPLSAVVGRRDIMAYMEKIFFSGTFGGETLSLAAALATIKKMKSRNVPEYLRSLGEELLFRLERLLEQLGRPAWIQTAGHPSWSSLTFGDSQSASMWELKTYCIQELSQRGVLCIGSHNLSYAHTPEHIDLLMKAYSEILPAMVQHVDEGTLQKVLRCEVLEPVFSVR